MAEDYLLKGEAENLIAYAEERLGTHPHDVWAYWYIGQAKYRMGAYPESKRCFEKVELELNWYNSVDLWLEQFDAKIKEGNQLVE